MDAYQDNREAILRANEEVVGIIQRAESILEVGSSSFEQWRHSCENISRYLMDHVVRIAVVGAIKSGKSTLVNAILQEDYLKRGAGVVTSIVTRVRQGKRLRARLFFKSWDEVNADIQQALVLFPSDDWRSEDRSFDIRRDQDRNDLKNALEALDSSVRIVQDSLNANSVLLASYLKGYDQVHAFVAADSNIRDFEGKTFGDYRQFVASDALAVYLKDIQLDVTGDVVSANMEIADCQGSDSPNPLHLAMIQDYLLKAHLVIYVISSRTGLRQADIRFLSMIKRMGISANMLFVCNCDLNEHENLDDLKALVQRIYEELSLVIDRPKMFVLSALYNLFTATADHLTEKDRDRLDQWRKATKQVAYSDEQTAALKQYLENKLTRERSALLLQNQLERLDVNTKGLAQWVRLNRDLLRRDAGDAATVAEKLSAHSAYMKQVQSMIQSTMEGAVQKVNLEHKKEVDRFFDYHTGPIIKNVYAFVRDYHLDLQRYREDLKSSGFTHTLYLVYQDLKQAVDGYMAEKVNPEIIGFISQVEARLEESLKLVAQPYEAMVRDALMKYEDELAQFGVASDMVNPTLKIEMDLEAVKQSAGISLPAAAATMRYSANIKTEAVMRLGLYSLIRLFQRVLKKASNDTLGEETRALKDGIRRMKAETERSLIALFKDYRENIKFQYVQRLVQTSGTRLCDLLTEKFGGYLGDMKALVAAIADKRNDRDQLDQTLSEIEQELTALHTKLETTRQTVTTLLSQGDTEQ